MPGIHGIASRFVLTLVVIGTTLAAVPAGGAGRPADDLSPDGVPLRLVLALDGIPFDLFAEMQQRGNFGTFRPAARMVSTFPSLSDVAFAAISGASPPDGYQQMRFDRERNRVVGNTLRSLSGEAHDHLPVDSEKRSSFHRMIGYVASYRTALGELERIGDDLLSSPKATFVGYVEATDAVLHVHGREQAGRFLSHLDAFLQDLDAEVLRRTGRHLAMDIVSDHGSTLERGRRVGLERALRRCGFERSARLGSSDEVAYALAGIIGSIAISCAPDRAAEVARCLAERPEVDIVAFPRGDAVAVVSSRGEAEIRLARAVPETYAYRLVHDDPLGIGRLFGIDATMPRPVAVEVLEQTVFDLTLDQPYPDPLRRLFRAFHGAVQQPADVLVSLKDGYEAGQTAVRWLARVRGRAGTHGSLTRAASLGVLASNWIDVADTDAWGARDQLFGDDVRSAVRQLGVNLARSRGAEGRTGHHARREETLETPRAFETSLGSN